LRLWPHNPLVLRKTIAPTRLGEMPIAAGVTVVAYTQAAMFDERVFTESGTLNPARDPELYLHFSGGLHICAGRAINRVQIPQLVRSLIDRDIGRAGPPGFDGPFIDRLVVPLAPSKAAGPA
jgi:cytochrome P450